MPHKGDAVSLVYRRSPPTRLPGSYTNDIPLDTPPCPHAPDSVRSAERSKYDVVMNT
ncbi:hypothetical protein [Nitrosomonas sp. Nm58]|uniref:hypothetical protein n=1 Tax=Nitrosomonas sp. Nm58 TaxID=200126 RepID=UPI0015A710C1|nr:hypothetical protein [Nitrosomonas sp. Nm58]